MNLSGPVEAYVFSFIIISLAEMGDKSQLMSLAFEGFGLL